MGTIAEAIAFDKLFIARAEIERLTREEAEIYSEARKEFAARLTEAAAFLDALANLLSSVGLNKSINRQAAADCRAMAEKLRK